MSFEFSLSVNSCAKIKSVCRAIKFAAKRAHCSSPPQAARTASPSPSPAARPACSASAVPRRTPASPPPPARARAWIWSPPAAGSPPFRPAAPTIPSSRVASRSSSSPSAAVTSAPSATPRSTRHLDGRGPRLGRRRHGRRLKILGRDPSPAAVDCQLRATARKTDAQLGQPYDPRLFGSGLVDAAAAVSARAPGC